MDRPASIQSTHDPNQTHPDHPKVIIPPDSHITRNLHHTLLGSAPLTFTPSVFLFSAYFNLKSSLLADLGKYLNTTLLTKVLTSHGLTSSTTCNGRWRVLCGTGGSSGSVTIDYGGEGGRVCCRCSVEAYSIECQNSTNLLLILPSSSILPDRHFRHPPTHQEVSIQSQA